MAVTGAKRGSWAGFAMVLRVRFEEFDLQVPDGIAVHVYRWRPPARVRGTVQVAHGMAEHAGRYARLAQELVGQGYGVWAHDHRGHGKSSPNDEDLGHFGDEGGFDCVLGDLLAVREEIASHGEHSGRVALFAHSMGTFFTQAALASRPPAPWDAVILAGSDAPGGLRIGALLAAARVERRRAGKRGRSAALDAMVFGPYNASFRPTRTGSDWLSRDQAEVDAFIADPRTGFRLTNQAWIDFLSGRLEVGRAGFAAVSPKDLPILLLAGTRDPVGRKGAGVRQLATQMSAGGLLNVEVTLYPQARHELVNEINRDQIQADIIDFLGRSIG